MKKTLAFYMGYSQGFNGANYNSKNVFGSEINTIKLAEALSLTELYNIFIFVNILEEDEIIFNNISYLQLNKLNNFKYLDILVIVRYVNFFLYYKNRAKKLYIWICDSIVNPYYKGLRLEENGDNLLFNLKDNINGYICLSDWHLSNIKLQLEYDLSKINIIYNPIDLLYYKNNIPIIKNRFIFVPDPSRGLDILLDCLIYLQNYIPDISICVFRKNEFSDLILHKLKKLNNTILYNKESLDIVSYEFLQAEYFFYPANLCETFCNIAVEAQLYNTICIYNYIGGLTTTIADRGLQIHYDLNDPNYIIKTCKDILNLMNNSEKKNDFKIRGHEWAKTLDVNIIKNTWIKLFNS
jgi:glycosyltransferase involved in cell wall biosynthesis